MFDAIETRSRRRIFPQEALSLPNNWRGAFQCPLCNEYVFLRAGRLQAPHFAHFSTFEAQMCARFCSSLSGGGGGPSERRIARIYQNRVEFRTDRGWRQAQASDLIRPAFLRNIGNNNFLEMDEDEPLYSGESCLVLSLNDNSYKDLLGPFSKVTAKTTVWIAWDFRLPPKFDSRLADWLRNIKHPWEPPQPKVYGTVRGAHPGAIDHPVGKWILIEYQPFLLNYTASIQLTWEVELQGCFKMQYACSGQMSNERNCIYFRPLIAGIWSISSCFGGSRRIIVNAHGDPPKVRISSPFEIRSVDLPSPASDR
jgi:hypothetical protein